MNKEMTHPRAIDDLVKARMEDPAYAEAYARTDNGMAAAWALTEARHAAGLTQRELAVKAHLPQATVCRIEHGDNTTIDTLSKLAAALGKTLTVSIV